MSTGKQTVKDLADEAKKRIVLLITCVVGLSYLMSLTSSSVWVNLPAAASLILILRYVSLDMEMRKRAASYKKKTPSTNHVITKPLEAPTVVVRDKFSWRRKVDSPVVEAAIDHFTRHLISEWVTDLWYSRLTPDKDGPEELVQIVNGVLGEISSRAREVNLIDLLTRDIIDLICTHIEVYRVSQAKIDMEKSENLSMDRHDKELKLVLASENKLHPALFSAEAEHKVLQHLMDGLISLTFKHEDLQCSFFRYIVRELLACAVMRPVLNMANPRFINEKIESLVLSSRQKAAKGVTTSGLESHQKPNGTLRTSIGQDPSVNGLELVQVKRDNSGVSPVVPVKGTVNKTINKKDPLLSVDARSTHPSSTLPSGSEIVDRSEPERHPSGGEWGQRLDVISRRKTQALAPEHFENMWTRGRNYGNNPPSKQSAHNLSGTDMLDHPNISSKKKVIDGKTNADLCARNVVFPRYDGQSLGGNARLLTDGSNSTHPPVSFQEEKEHNLMQSEDDELESDNSYPTEDDENSNVMGLDSPGIKVWDSKNKTNGVVSHIRHPLESSEGHRVKKTGKPSVHYPRIHRVQSVKKRSRLSSQKTNMWQEIERTSFLLGDGKDLLNVVNNGKTEESNEVPELESWGRVHSGATASSSAASLSTPEARKSFLNTPPKSVLADSFYKLRCEVLGANVVKSDSRTFAVYSISVTGVDNSSWSIKRRFRHFEELHRRLKEFPEYNLSLPPKHFLSSGLDVFVVQERCQLLDKYLKRLVELPTVSGSIEVWDFLSVDSQTYIFSDCLSIIQTLSVDLNDKPYEKTTKVQHLAELKDDNHVSSVGQNIGKTSKETVLPLKQNLLADNARFRTRDVAHSTLKGSGKDYGNHIEDSSSESDGRSPRSASSIKTFEKLLKERVNDRPQDRSELLLGATTDSTLPTEWISPNLSAPILDLVDAIFQLQDGGWIRRQAFWVVKQVLQLGMGDAFDDWLIEKVQHLRKGPVVASAIERLEQILWPDGIFLTKHPKRQRPPQYVTPIQSPHHSSQSTPVSSPKNEDIQQLAGKDNNFLTDEQQQQEAARRAKLVYELMIDKAPAALVGLFGRKEYEKCVKDIYFFSQSSVCLKQLMFGLLEMLLLSAFPELDKVVKQLHEEKHKFGHVEA